MKNRIIPVLIISLFISLSIPIISSADELPYTAKPILPGNQDEEITNYISISTNENIVSQEVKFEVTNKTDDPIELFIQPVNSLTSPQGVIHYIDTIEEKNAMLLDKYYGISNYIDIVESVTLDGGESKIIKGTINISGIEGTILGAVSFKAKEKGELEGTQQFKINNELNTVIGLQVNFNDVNPTFQLGQPFVDPLPSYYAIRLPIALDSATLVQDIELEYEILDNKGKQLFSSNENGINFAPKTKTNFAIPWKSETIKDGETYTIKGSLSFNENSVEFEKEFEFNQDDAITNDESNDFQTPTIDENSFPWWIFIVLSILIVIIVIIIIVRKKSKKKDTADTTENEE